MAAGRYLHDALRLGLQTGFGINPFSPGLPASAAAFGIPGGGLGWQSDPIDARGQIVVSLEISPIAASPQAMLFAPSATLGFGLLAAANAPGTGGNAISLAIDAPAGDYLPPTIVGSAITLHPAAGMSNAALATQTNNDPNAGALIQLSTVGWSFYGDLTVALQDWGIQSAELDVVAALSATNLAGGAAAASQNAVVSIYGANDPSTGFDPSPLGQMNLGATKGTIQVATLGKRYLVAQLAPNAGSVGNVLGTWFGHSAS